MVAEAGVHVGFARLTYHSIHVIGCNSSFVWAISLRSASVPTVTTQLLLILPVPDQKPNLPMKAAHFPLCFPSAKVKVKDNFGYRRRGLLCNIPFLTPLSQSNFWRF